MTLRRTLRSPSRTYTETFEADYLEVSVVFANRAPVTYHVGRAGRDRWVQVGARRYFDLDAGRGHGHPWLSRMARAAQLSVRFTRLAGLSTRQVTRAMIRAGRPFETL